MHLFPKKNFKIVNILLIFLWCWLKCKKRWIIHRRREKIKNASFFMSSGREFWKSSPLRVGHPRAGRCSARRFSPCPGRIALAEFLVWARGRSPIWLQIGISHFWRNFEFFSKYVFINRIVRSNELSECALRCAYLQNKSRGADQLLDHFL